MSKAIHEESLQGTHDLTNKMEYKQKLVFQCKVFNDLLIFLWDVLFIANMDNGKGQNIIKLLKFVASMPF